VERRGMERRAERRAERRMKRRIDIREVELQRCPGSLIMLLSSSVLSIPHHCKRRKI
jgi:hypothetical protein